MIRLIGSRSHFCQFYSTIISKMNASDLLKSLDISDSRINPGIFDGEWKAGSGSTKIMLNPSNNQSIASVQTASHEDLEPMIQKMIPLQSMWREVPAPKRGDLVRAIRDKLSSKKQELGALISMEMGKILQEGIGEVQEYIDICDYAIGLSRSINGQVIPSERPGHFMMEAWHPLGITAVITAFNFPAAVYGWNSAIALVCGNPVLWKPAPTTCLIAIAITKLLSQALKEQGYPQSLCSLVTGDAQVGQLISQNPLVKLVSFTGSTKVGRQVGLLVQERFGKSILELGGNNAIVIMEDADLQLALRSVLFSAVGTTGQRCTTVRRLYLQESIHDSFLEKLSQAYQQIIVGNPLSQNNVLCGPLHSKSSVEMFHHLVQSIPKQKGKIIYGGRQIFEESGGNFVQPTIATIPADAEIVQSETFVPVLYVMKFKTFEEAIELNNSVKQGLSSSIFTKNPNYIFRWTGSSGSDCGLANVNIPTSGAEIGGAFGGEKETGGGRESGSTSWQQYMRRQTW